MARVSTALSFPLHDFVFPRHYRQAVESREAKRTTSRSGFRLYTPSPPGTGHLPVLDILGVAGVLSLDYRIPYTMLRYGQAENTPHRCAQAHHSLRYEFRSSIPKGVLIGKKTYNAGVAKASLASYAFFCRWLPVKHALLNTRRLEFWRASFTTAQLFFTEHCV